MRYLLATPEPAHASFDLRQDGIRRLLNTLRAAVRLLRTNGAPPDLRLERQLAFHAAAAVHRYMAAHLTLHLDDLESSAAGGGGIRRHTSTDRMVSKRGIQIQGSGYGVNVTLERQNT